VVLFDFLQNFGWGYGTQCAFIRLFPEIAALQHRFGLIFEKWGRFWVLPDP
jgi:hypothetical protein